ncbi:hypothetical protein ACFX16_037735 [Malus domestica]
MGLRTNLKSYAKNMAIYDAPLAHDWKEIGLCGGKNRAEALMVLARSKRGLESLPKDLAVLVQAGRIPRSFVGRNFELENPWMQRWSAGRPSEHEQGTRGARQGFVGLQHGHSNTPSRPRLEARG